MALGENVVSPGYASSTVPLGLGPAEHSEAAEEATTEESPEQFAQEQDQDRYTDGGNQVGESAAQEEYPEEPAPEDWPEELKAKWQEAEKRRIADYTRKTQNVADRRKRLEAKESELTKKAQSYDLLMQNPELLRKQLFGDMAPTAGAAKTAETEEDPTEVLEPEAKRAVEWMAEKIAGQKITELTKKLSTYEGYINQLARKDVEREWGALVEKYPSASEHKDAVAQFVQQTGITDMKQALFAVAGESLVGSAQKSLLRKNAEPHAKSASPSRPRVPGESIPAGKTVPHDKPVTLYDAMLQVAKEQGVRV